MTGPHQLYTVDGISAEIARLEDPSGVMIEVPARLLPPGVQEGQVLRGTVDGSELSFTVDLEAERAVRARVRGKLDRLRQGGGR